MVVGVVVGLVRDDRRRRSSRPAAPGAISPVEALQARLEPAAPGAPGCAGSSPCSSRSASPGLLVWPREPGEAGVVRAARVYASCSSPCSLSPFLLGALGRVAGAPFASFFRLEERLARASLGRDRSRTALTVGALAVGLAMIVAVGGVAETPSRARRAGSRR